jgi:surfeit locus 1 family protein
MNTSGKTPPAPKFRVTLNWKLVLFALVFLPVLISLGVWQLQRAEEKRNIQESWQSQQALPPVQFANMQNHEAAEFRRVRVQGTFDAEHYWLVENQVLDGKLGYEVLMPLVVKGSTTDKPAVLIVNRGWVPADPYRKELPEISTPENSVEITGSLITPGVNRLITNQAQQVDDWPVRVLQADLDLFGDHLRSAGYAAEPYARLLRIDADSVGALTVSWQPMNMSPAKHVGYAVQWFSMALALLILSIVANTNLSEILARKKRA